MILRRVGADLTVCKVVDPGEIDLSREFTFVARTDEELSVVCPTDAAPASALAREDGWRAFRVEGVLDFGLTGILARISGILAENGIPIFAVSTYNTDYVLVRRGHLERALAALADAGYTVA